MSLDNIVEVSSGSDGSYTVTYADGSTVSHQGSEREALVFAVSLGFVRCDEGKKGGVAADQYGAVHDKSTVQDYSISEVHPHFYMWRAPVTAEPVDAREE